VNSTTQRSTGCATCSHSGAGGHDDHNRTGEQDERTWAEFGWFGLTTILLRRTDPIVGSPIATDRCNLACAHCAVANIRRINYPFERLRADMHSMSAQGSGSCSSTAGSRSCRATVSTICAMSWRRPAASGSCWSTP
jgi:hypothetical protein